MPCGLIDGKVLKCSSVKDTLSLSFVEVSPDNSTIYVALPTGRNLTISQPQNQSATTLFRLIEITLC